MSEHVWRLLLAISLTICGSARGMAEPVDADEGVAVSAAVPITDATATVSKASAPDALVKQTTDALVMPSGADRVGILPDQGQAFGWSSPRLIHLRI
jgi:hypothetical protein